MPGNFDDTAKEEIRQRADIAAIVGRYVKLKPSGATLKGLCPFHKEKTPSFHVNPARGFYHCFGCAKGGDVFTFLQEIEGVTFPEALRMLADETGVKLAPARRPDPAAGAEESGPALSKTVLLDIHKLAADYFYGQIRANPEAVEYFKSRGLAAETVRDFRLGFAPAEWTALLSFAGKKGVSAEALVACGLAVRKEDGSVYDRFRDRVMFSLLDLSGRAIAFAGRGRDKDATPKYLNSPETPLYRKKEFLYGLHATRNSIKEERCALVVEGYMDFLTLYQSGIRNAVATSGTAMTPEHAHLLKRFTSRVVLVFDGDEAGQNAARRGVFTLAPMDLDVSVLVLPSDEDPDSFVRKQGPDAFRERAAGARPANDFIIDAAIAEHGAKTPRSQKAVIEQLAPLFHSMNDSLARTRFRKDLADRLAIDEKAVQEILRRPGSAGRTAAGSVSDAELFVRSLEGSFLHALFTRPEFIPEARRYIEPDTLTDSISANIYSILLKLYEKQGSLDGIGDSAPSEEMRRLISRMLVAPALEEHIHEELVQKIIHLRRKFLKNRIRANRILLKSEPNPSRRDQIMLSINEDLNQLRNLEEE